MGKLASSYESVSLGVSQQAAHLRRSGQMDEQINLISDPVYGLVRRRGSKWQNEQAVASTVAYATLAAEANAMKEYTFNIAGIEYSLLYRAVASTSGSPSFMYLYNKAAQTFVPIVYENSTWVDTLISGGVSAVVCAGKYLYVAGNSNTPVYTAVDNWDALANVQKLAAWVRGGAYARTFTVSVTKTDGSIVTGTYTTDSSAYGGTLDTSDISIYLPDGTTIDPAYQKNVNDRVNAYNSAAALWIGTAAADIVPGNIANQLAASLVAQGIVCTVYDGTVCINDPTCVELTCDDGGDGTLMKSVGKQVQDPTDMTLVHYVGKVVQVRPQGSTDSEAYYLVAYAQDGVSTGWTDVIWKEGPGVVQTPQNIVTMGVMQGGTMYFAQNGPGLDSLTSQPVGTNPTFKPSTVGDGVSAPAPNFFGTPITMLAMFQDRLVIGSQGTVNCSWTGDYLNFYRATVLMIKDTDPIEMYSYGSEGDTLRYGVMFDRSLIIFGDLAQYVINGQAVLSAQNPLIVMTSGFKNSTNAWPTPSGNFVFFGTYNEGRSALQQLQVGQLLTSPVAYEVSQQLDTYIQGPPAQIYALTSPNMIFLRTTTTSNTFYVYQYVDDQGGGNRLYDSWSKWQFNPVLGTVCGVSSYKGEVLVYSLRAAGGQTYVVADKINLTNDTSDTPYMDSLKPYTGLAGWMAAADPTQFCVAVDNTSPYFLMGTDLPDAANLIAQLPGVNSALWVGAVQPAFVQPTNPYIKQFLMGIGYRPMLTGRLTLSQVIPTVQNSGALIGSVNTVNGGVTNLQFQGRLLGRSTNIIAQQPLITGTLPPLAVGREIRECSYSFSSDTWLPMNITALSWTGQYFNRVRTV